MATVSLQPAPVPSLKTKSFRAEWTSGAGLCALLTCSAFLVHGYHPYAEDGGIYLTGVKYLLNRHLYPYATAFVTSHLSFSCFAWIVAALVRLTTLNVMTVMLGVYVLSVWLTLSGAWAIAGELFTSSGRRWSVAVLAAGLTLPVAGTSLMLVDPYASARSLATPCILFAMASALTAFRQRHSASGSVGPWLRCVLAASVAVLLHPLMGGYGVVLLLLFGILTIRKRKARISALVIFVCAAAVVALCGQRLGPLEPSGYPAIAQTRTYWFLSEWAWYEWLGLVCPLGILAWFARPSSGSLAGRLLAKASVIAGVTGTVLALLFAHPYGNAYCVARLQPLRIFQIIYLLMALFLGATIASLRKQQLVAGCVVCGSVALALCCTDRSVYAHSNHLELPWVRPVNQWEQGFVWLREHTRQDEVVAIDADYISAPGEDAHNVRAISERSTPPDLSKDGGIAAIKPGLSAEWLAEEPLQSGLNVASDSQRIDRLVPHGIRWIVLNQIATTTFKCPYGNQAIKVCELPLP